MKVTILGNRSPFPTRSSGCAGYLLQTEDQNILIDVGPGTLERLNEIIPYYQLDAIIISHLHEDHFLDLLPLRYAFKLSVNQGKREEALAVYLPFEAGRELNYIKRKVGSEFHLQQISEDIELYLEELTISFKQTKHPKKCFAIKVSDGKKSLGYTADTAYNQELIYFLSNTDLLLTEASLLEVDNQKRELGHMTVKEAVEFGVAAKTKELLLTHLGSIYKKEDIIAEIPKVDIKVKVSKVGNIYFL